MKRRQELSSGEPRQPTGKPVLLEAIDITLCTIEDRARLYRNLVAAMSMVSALSILSAVLFRQWVAFAGFLLLVPLTGGFLFLDSRRVRRWRAVIVENSLTRGLDMAMFRKTISGFRYLPVGSLQAMLSTLPSDENASHRQTQAHNDIGDEFDSLRRKHEWKVLGATGLLTLTLLCLAGTAVYRSFGLLPCAAACIILLSILRRG